MASLDLREELLKASLRASARARRVFMLLQVLTILVGVAFFNSWRHNWTAARIDVFKHAQKVVSCLPGEFSGISFAGNSESLNQRADEIIKQARVSSCIPLDPLQPEDRRWVESVKYVLRAGYAREDIEKRLEKLRDFWADVVTTIPIPLTGLRVDINGLGTVAGCGFSVLLLWLFLSMRRESDNYVKLTKKFPEAALLIETDQVFTIGPRNTRGIGQAAMSIFRALGGVVVVAFVIPLLLLMAILWTDWHTREVGMWANPTTTNVTLGIELVGLIVNLALAVLCIREQLYVTKAVDEAMDPSTRASIQQGGEAPHTGAASPHR